MGKLLFYFAFFFLFTNQIFAQLEGGKITGKLIIAKDGISIGASKELSRGTQLDFESDGKTISVSIGGQLFSDSTISSGIGVKLSNRPCFFMTISDGIEFGALKPEGSGNGLGNLLNLKEEVIFSSNLGIEGEVCIDWLDNKALIFKPLNGKYQSVLSIPNILVENILDFAFNFSMNPTFESDYTRKGYIDFEGNSELVINSYCLDWDLEIPSSGIPYKVSDNLNPPEYLDVILNPSSKLSLHRDINNFIWYNEILKGFEEKYISEVAMFHDKNSNYNYAKFYFMGIIEVLYLPSNNTSKVEEFLNNRFPIFYSSKKLENGDVVVSFDEFNGELILEKFAQKKDYNLAYVQRHIELK